MDIKVKRGWAKKVICFFLRRLVKKMFGVKVKFNFTENTNPTVTSDDKGKTHISLSIEAEVDEASLEKYVDEHCVD